jgi:hypothetical protein
VSCDLWGVFFFFLSVCVYGLVEEHIHDWCLFCDVRGN